jgi:hypothetical protein
LEGGVEPLSVVTLFDLAAGPGEESDLDPTNPVVVLGAVAPWPAVFTATASVDTFAMASMAAFITVALSAATFSTTALSLATFSVVALSAATFTVAASSAAFTVVTSSAVLISTAFSVTAAATETSLTVEEDPMPLDLLGAIDATIELGSAAQWQPQEPALIAWVR